MEPPPPPAPAIAATSTVAPAPAPPPHMSYPDSVDSSPRSRNTDSWDEPSYQGGAPLSAKLRLMCSYGGHIVPRPHDKSLCYAGGDTRIVVVDRQTSLSDLCHRLSKTLLDGRSFTLKYQLPNEDLDSLISVATDEDVENMIDEYDRLNSAANTTSNKSSRLRLFLFPSKPESGSSIGSLLENPTKSEDWFLNALNGATRGLSGSSSVNCLLGLDDEIAANNNANSADKDGEAQIESFGNVKGVSGGSNKQTQDVHSVPDSPMLGTTSSFGSASSAPSLGNLPPIRVHVEDQSQRVGIEEQFSQMNIGSGPNTQMKQDDGGFVVLSSQQQTVLTTAAAAATTTVVPGVPVSGGVVVGEYPNRNFSEDERSEQGIPIGYGWAPQAQFQTSQPPPQPVPTQLQQKQVGGFDLPSPDSVSSDGSLTNPSSRQRPAGFHQDPLLQIPSGNNRIADQNARIQIQQVQESGYMLPTQFDQQQLQLHQQPQFLHSSSQFLHHPPPGAVSVSPYYMYPPPPQQQQHHHLPGLDQQFPVYYMQPRQTQPYSMPMVQPPSYSEPAPATATAAASSRPQTSPPASMVPTPTTFNPTRNAPPGPKQPEMAAGVYRTSAMGTPQFFQVPANQNPNNQQQFVGYSQIHHPSQSSASPVNYSYEFTDPSHAHQIYYAHQMAPPPPQYQTVTSSAEAAGQQVQVRTSQP